MGARVVDADRHVLEPLAAFDRIVRGSGYLRHDSTFPGAVDGDRVAVEIRLRMNGTVSLAGDFFTIAGDRISRLVVYNGPAVT